MLPPGEFCVTAQGKESLRKWKDVLCNLKFAFLLPKQTQEDEETSYLYMDVNESEDSDPNSFGDFSYGGSGAFGGMGDISS